MIAPRGNGVGGRGGLGAGDADLVDAADSVADGEEGERVEEEDELIERVDAALFEARAEEDDVSEPRADTLADAETESPALLASDISSKIITGLQPFIL